MTSIFSGERKISEVYVQEEKLELRGRSKLGLQEQSPLEKVVIIGYNRFCVISLISNAWNTVILHTYILGA